MSAKRPGQRAHREGAWLLAIAVALFTAVVCFVFHPSVQAAHNADTLLRSLISTQQWTPFYWGADRLGTLFSLLAMPVRDPIWNLLVIGLLSTTGAVLAALLLGVYLAGGRIGLLAGVTGGLLLPCLSLGYTRFLWFIGHPEQIPALAFGLAGLLVLHDRTGSRASLGWPPWPWRRLALAGALMLLGSWVNPTQVAILVPLVILRAAWGRDSLGSSRLRGTAMLVAMLLGSALLLLAVPRLLDLPPTDHRLLPFAQWPRAWGRLAAHAAGAVDTPAFWSLVVILALAAAAGLACGARNTRSAIASILGPGFGASAACFLAFAISAHTAANDAAPRYAFMPIAVALVTLAAAGLTVIATIAPRAGSPPATLLLATVCAAALAWASGWPSAERVRSRFEQLWGPTTREILAARATHVTGDYWFTWLHVYHANAILHGEGAGRSVFGLAHRGEATRHRWRTLPAHRWRIAAPRGFDLDSAAWVYRHLGVPPIDPLPRQTWQRIEILGVERDAE